MIQELQVPSVSAGSKQGSQEAFLRRSGPRRNSGIESRAARCRLTCGRVHLSWISDAYIDEHCRRCSVDTPERHFVVSTAALHRTRPTGFSSCHAGRFRCHARPEVNYSLTLRAASHEDAIAWTTALQDAIAETRDYDPWAAKGKSKGSTIDKE